MRIFVTGATGFIGTELVHQLTAAGHQVRGLSRSEEGADQLNAAGIEVHRGSLTDLESLRTGAAGMDAVVHLAFSHDFSTFAQNAQDEINAIEALGAALEPGKRLIVTSGTAMAGAAPGHLRLESDPPSAHAAIPRRPEQAAQAAVDRGVHVSVVRLSQIHDTRKQGLITYLRQVAAEKGISAYLGDGANRWAAAPLTDTAHLYHLVAEQTTPGFTVYHAVHEEGVSLKEIAEAIGRAMNLPVQSIPQEQAAEHFRWMAGFLGLDMPASSEWTRRTLNWEPTGPGLLEDLSKIQ